MRHVSRIIGTILLTLMLSASVVVAASSPDHDRLPDDRVLYIAPGQSLVQLVRQLYPERRTQWAGIRSWIVRHNPHAFIGGDPSRLRANVRVRLPTASALAAADRPDASESAASSAGGQAGDSGPRMTFGERYVFVDPAQSLGKLVPRLYPDQRRYWSAIIDAILERNGDRLRALGQDQKISRGTRLQIPGVRAHAPSPAEVAEEPAAPEHKPEPPPERVVAEVIRRTGSLYAVDSAERRRSLAVSAAVRRSDTVHTGSDGRAVIEFRDGEKVFLRRDSALRVRDWHLPETGPGTRVVELLRGGLRAITGAIGHRDGDTYRTVTPQATLGVRGTDYALRVCAEAECRVDGADDALDPGLYVGVHRGRISLLNEAGEAIVDSGKYRRVAGPASAPEKVDAAVAGVLFSDAERAQWQQSAASPEPASPEAAKEDEGASWGWLAIGAVLLGAAL